MEVCGYGGMEKYSGMTACGHAGMRYGKQDNISALPRFSNTRVEFFRNTEYNSVSVALHFVQHAICNARQTPL